MKKNVFSYGPEYPVYDDKYYKSKILPKIISDLTDMFRYYSCTFRVTPGKKTTARVVFNQACDIVSCYTIEASNGGYISEDGNKQTDFSEQLWIQMGQFIGIGIFQYIQTQSRMLAIERIQMQELAKASEAGPANGNGNPEGARNNFSASTFNNAPRRRASKANISFEQSSFD